MGEKLPCIGVPMAIGLSLGTLIVSDPFIGHAMRLPLRLPLVLTELLVLSGIGTLALMAHRHWLFVQRERLLIGLLVVSPAFAGLSIGSVDAAEIAMLIAFPAWCLLILVEPRCLHTWPPLFILCLCLAFAALASAINGGLGSLIASRAILAKLMLVLLLVSLISTRAHLHDAVRLLVGLAVLNAILAGVQEIGFLLEPQRIIQSLAESGDQRALDAVKSTPWGPMLRAAGLLTHYRGLGHYMLLNLALVSFGPFSRRFARGAAVLMLLGLLLTISFGAYTNAVVTGLLILYCRRPRRAIHYTCCLLFLLVLGYSTGVLGWFGENIFRVLGEESGKDRLELFWTGLEALARYPILGIGFHNLGRISIFPEGWPVHNAFLQIASETGLLGGLSFTALIGLIVVRACVLAGNTADVTDRWIAKGLFVGCVAMLIDFMVEPFADNVVSWLYLGVTAAAINLHRRMMIAGNAGETETWMTTVPNL